MRACALSWLSLLISRRALAPGFLDEPDASAFRLIGKLEVDRLLRQSTLLAEQECILLNDEKKQQADFDDRVDWYYQKESQSGD